MNRKLMIGTWILLIVLASAMSSALGVMPSSKKITESTSYQLIIVNDAAQDFRALLSVQGDLAEYIELSEEILVFKPSDDMKRITVSIDIPDNLDIEGGDHENYIFISQGGSDGGGVEAKVNIVSTINIFKPYDSQALSAKIFVTNFDRNKQNNFVIEVQNIGTEDVPSASTYIDIYSATSDKIATIEGKKVSLKKGEKILVDVPWSPDFPNGKYFARAHVLYGDRTASDEKVFSIGYPEIIIDSISASSFKLGGIAAFDIIISSTWIEPIEVFADVYLSKEDTVTYRTKTVTKVLSSLGKTNLPAFLETAGLEPGKYSLNIDLNYLGGKKSNKYDIFLEQDAIRMTGPSGQVTTDVDGEGSPMTLLLIIVLILVVLNGIVVYKFVIMKKKEK